MANLILVCTRDRAAPGPSDERLAAAARRITPDHLPAPELLVTRSPGLTAALIGRREAVPHTPHAVALGCLGTTAQPTWCRVGGGRPEAAALVRWNDDRVEALADGTASRTLWFLSSPEALWVSTSQRALVYLTGAFERNEEVLPWFLAGGNLGPHRAGWDRRLTAVGPDGWLRLDRATWRLDSGEPDVAFEPLDGDARLHAERLRTALEATFATADPANGRWLLPLSGGKDSRTLLITALAAGWRPPCITWGTPASQRLASGDAAVAAELARLYQLDHQFLPLEAEDLPAETMLERFVANGGGRSDAIGGYVDGFALWRGLFERNVGGILRGDACAGWKSAIRTPEELDSTLGAPRLADLEGLPAAVAGELPEQRHPDGWSERPGESLQTRFDRLHRTFRVATVMAALTHLKAHYVEIANPLLARHVLEVVRTVPEAVRLGRDLQAAFLEAHGPAVPLATEAAIPTPWDTIGRTEVGAVLLERLGDPSATDALPAAVVEHALVSVGEATAARARELAPRPKAPAWRRLVRRVRKLAARPAPRPTPDRPPRQALMPGQFGLRACLAVETARLYAEDAAAGRRSAPGTG